MKALKKMILVLIAVAFILPGLSLTAAHAAVAPGYYTATISASGQSNAQGYVQLTDVAGSFTDTWFGLNLANTNQLLATALTAMSLGAKVTLYFDGTNILVLYATNQ